MDNGLVKGIQDCGAAYECQKMWIPELMPASEAMELGISLLKPLMAAEWGAQSLGKVVLATVEGDVHDIGVELVGVMLESASFTVRFMGGNVPTKDIINALKEDKPDLLGLSTLLSNTMHVMPDILKILDNEGIRDSIKVIIGGAPVRQEYCGEIGADGYAPDAVQSVPLAKKLRGLG